MRQACWARFATMMLLVGVGCRKPAPAESPAALIFAVLPAVQAADTREVYQPLLEALARAAGRPVVLHIAADYPALQQELVAGRVQLAQASAYLYATIAVARAKVGQPVFLLAQEQRTTDSRHAGALVVNAASDIRAVGELAGKRIAWVDRFSSSGYIYPRLRLRELGHDPDRLFADQIFAGSHDAVLVAVRRGEVEVGAVSELSASTSGLRILEYTAPIPDDAILCLDGLDTADRAALTRFFLGAHEDPALTNFFVARGLERYVAAEIAVYESGRRELERAVSAAP